MEFIKLTAEQETKFRAWAREHYQPNSEISEVWHPAVQDECQKINTEFKDRQKSNDPVKNFYLLGYADVKEGRTQKRRVPQNYKLAYLNGKYDARKNRISRYAGEKS